jgi:hypothetical protein
VQRKSPHVIFSALVAAIAVGVSTVMAAATASTLASIMVFIIGTAAGVLGWGCVFLNHLRVEQSWCDRHVTIRDRGTVDVTGGRPIAHSA